MGKVPRWMHCWRVKIPISSLSYLSQALRSVSWGSHWPPGKTTLSQIRRVLQAFWSEWYPALWTKSSSVLPMKSDPETTFASNSCFDSICSRSGNLKIMPTLDWMVLAWDQYCFIGYSLNYPKKLLISREVFFIPFLALSNYKVWFYSD